MNRRLTRGPSGYPRLWIASVSTGLSGWMVQIGLFVTLVAVHSATVMATVLLIATLPALLLGPFIGSWIDRHDVPWMAAVAQWGQAVLLPVIGFLLDHHVGAMTGLYALFSVLGSLGATARQQLHYRVIAPSRWAEVNARLGGVTGITTIVGAILGGTAALWGLMDLLMLAAGLRLIAGGVLWSLVPLQRARPFEPTTDTRGSYRQTLREGFQALRTFPTASSVLLVGMAWGLIGGSYDVLLTDYGVRLWHGGGLGVSGLYITDGIGVMLGTALARVVQRQWRPHAYGLAYLLQGLFWTLFALSHTWVVAVPWLLLMRMASGLIIAWDTTLLLETVPRRLHSRVFSLHNATYGSVGKISLALTAIFLAWAGPEGIAVGAGVGSMLVGTTWWGVIGRRWPPSGAPTTVESERSPQADPVATEVFPSHDVAPKPPSSFAS